VLDVAIVGAGTAGLAALREVRKQTDRFLLVNDGPWGTTCARVGCMPSKVLLEAAHAFHRRKTFEEFGIRGAEGLSVDLPAALRRVRRLRDGFVAAALKATDDLGERKVDGRARLLGPGRLEVNGREMRARSIILATGSTPVVPGPWQALGDRILTTDTLFEQETLPGRMAVVGMGAVGTEMAQALARLGIEVHAFDLLDTVAGVSDPEVRDALVESLGREFALHLGAPAELRAEGGGVAVGNGTVGVEVDRVLVALGRRPNLAGLGLETLGVALDEHGMPPLDQETMQIADLPVFFAGDANAHAAVLHEAADEGYIAGMNAVAGTPACYRRRAPLAITFCEPNAARVGPPFSALDPVRTAVGHYDFRRQGRAVAAQRNEGVLRVYGDRESGRLLGAELCAPSGEHLAHLLALAVERSLTVQELLGMPYYHPVVEEGLRTALRALAREVGPEGVSDLEAC
jgi:dihydrolipoamide dehydrogenase